MRETGHIAVEESWLPNLPTNWKLQKMKQLFKSVSGGTPSKDQAAFWIGDIPWVSPKDMKSETILDTEDHISVEAIAQSATTLVPSNTILIVVRSGILQHTIPIAITTREMAINQDLKALIPRQQDILPEYYAAFIRGFQAQLLTLWRKEGATVESLESETIGKTSVPVPPLKEQQSIVKFLSRETAKIDSLIGSGMTVERAGKLYEFASCLRERRTALITAAVTGQIDTTEPAMAEAAA